VASTTKWSRLAIRSSLILSLLAGVVLLTSCFSYCTPTAPLSLKMYVTNEGNDTITVANLDGTGGTALAATSGKHPLHRYRRRLAKGFKCCLHRLIEDVGIDHRGGQV